MWGHFSDKDLVDALLGSARSGSDSHLTSCAGCSARLLSLRDGLRSAREAEVPEPSPVYWEAFRRQVDERLDVRPGAWSFGLRPALATALVVFGLLGFLPGSRVQREPASGPLPAWSALPPLADDAGLRVLQGLASPDEDWLAQPGVVGLVSGLSEAEREALAVALRAELARGRS